MLKGAATVDPPATDQPSPLDQPTQVIPDADNPDFHPSKAPAPGGLDVEVVGDETETLDPSAGTGEAGTPGTTDGADQGADTPHGLLSAEELAEVKANPVLSRLFTSLNQSYTQKSQRFADGARLMEALQHNPQAAVLEMAKRLGLDVKDPGVAPVQDTALDEVRSTLTDSLGEDLAGKLMPAFEKLASRIVESKIKPVEESLSASLAESALNESQSVVDAFAAEVPDYGKYEPQMLLLSSKILPGDDMSEGEYLRLLYTVARARADEGDHTKRAIARVQDSARASESSAAGIPSSRVTKTAPKGVTGTALVREAVRAAMRGERWDG